MWSPTVHHCNLKSGMMQFPPSPRLEISARIADLHYMDENKLDSLCIDRKHIGRHTIISNVNGPYAHLSDYIKVSSFNILTKNAKQTLV
jgi:hypothetical protein